MDGDTTTPTDTFCKMASDFPVRTGIFTFGLPLFALFQVLNAVVYGGSFLSISVFVVLAVACSILLTQYQIAVYRRRQLTRVEQ